MVAVVRLGCCTVAARGAHSAGLEPATFSVSNESLDRKFTGLLEVGVIIAKPLSARYPAVILRGNNSALEDPSGLGTDLSGDWQCDQPVPVGQNYQHEGRTNADLRVDPGLGRASLEAACQGCIQLE